jgi:hypothetical protein
METRANEPEIEIIPPGKEPAGARRTGDPLTKDPILTWLAGLMDSAFVIPGTKVRVGLDPIIGLIPFIGDAVGTLVSTFIVARCGALGLPRIILARMAINVALNALVGAIPGAGDLFSFWFRSNDRNLNLAREWLANPKRATTRDWAVVLGVLAAILAAAIGMLWAFAFIIQGAWKAVSAFI